jgi:hypothetical protein
LRGARDGRCPCPISAILQGRKHVVSLSRRLDPAGAPRHCRAAAMWHNQPYRAQHQRLHLPEQTSSASSRRIITVAVSSATTRTSAIVAAFSEKSPRRDGRREGGNRKAPRFDLRIERSADFIAEFVRLKVDVIVTMQPLTLRPRTSQGARPRVQRVVVVSTVLWD